MKIDMKLFTRFSSFITTLFALLAVSPIYAFAQTVNIKPDIAPEVSIPGFIKAVINLLFVVAAVIAIVFLIYGGIRWILSGGDKAGVEAARNTIIAAIIGLVIVVLSYFILSVVFQFLGIPLFTNFNIPTLTDPSLRPS